MAPRPRKRSAGCADACEACIRTISCALARSACALRGRLNSVDNYFRSVDKYAKSLKNKGYRASSVRGRCGAAAAELACGPLGRTGGPGGPPRARRATEVGPRVPPRAPGAGGAGIGRHGLCPAWSLRRQAGTRQRAQRSYPPRPGRRLAATGNNQSVSHFAHNDQNDPHLPENINLQMNQRSPRPRLGASEILRSWATAQIISAPACSRAKLLVAVGDA